MREHGQSIIPGASLKSEKPDEGEEVAEPATKFGDRSDRQRLSDMNDSNR